jgi:hypothetical protein
MLSIKLTYMVALSQDTRNTNYYKEVAESEKLV